MHRVSVQVIVACEAFSIGEVASLYASRVNPASRVSGSLTDPVWQEEASQAVQCENQTQPPPPRILPPRPTSW